MSVSDLLIGGDSWWILPCSLIAVGAAFGLLPGLMLRLIVLLYPKQHPRREELFGELYDPKLGRMERFEWVFQQLELATRQGLSLRRSARIRRREIKRMIEIMRHIPILMSPNIRDANLLENNENILNEVDDVLARMPNSLVD
ncbi:hypothetical protein [Actinophytocola sediminis]